MSLGWALALVGALECASAVRLMGDEAVRAPLVDALVARRVSVAAAGECASLVASVSARRGGVRLELLIGTRQVVREVTGTSMAAVVIESWLRPDLAQPLLSPRAAPTLPSAPIVTTMPGDARRESGPEGPRAAGSSASRVARAAAPTPARAVSPPIGEAPREDATAAAAPSSPTLARTGAAVIVPVVASPTAPDVPVVASPTAPDVPVVASPTAPDVPVVASPTASDAPLALAGAPESAPAGDSPTPPIPRTTPAAAAPAADVDAPAPASPAEATPSALASPAEAAPVLASVTAPWVRSGPPPGPDDGRVDAPRAPGDAALTGGEPLLADWSFTLAPVVGVDETSALWGGGQVRAANALDGLVLEVRARVAYSEVQGSLQSSVSERWLAEALVGAAWPLVLVESALELELAAGVGPRIVRVARGDGSSSCLMRAECAVVVPDGFAVTGLTPAGQASVGLVWRATEHLALELTGSASWAPWASDLARVPAYAASLTGEEQARWALAGEPTLVWVGALGLRWSGR
jgi:hypothetical protein